MSILLTILILGIIVFVHELGHFLTAKYYNMPVIEFSIGMGTKLVSKKIGDTIYSIRLLPFGGYVNIENEGKEGFRERPPIHKFVVLIAGVVMNFLTAIIGIYILVNLVNFNIQGIFFEKIKITFVLFSKYFMSIIEGTKMLFTGKVNPSEITGPVGLPKIIGDVYKNGGSLGLINIFVVLSINIGIMNLLPIPALDGGRIVLLIPEFFGIKINKKVEMVIQMIGIILLLSFMAFVIFNDVFKYFK